MNPDRDPEIVSLEAHRRRKLADARKKPAAPVRRPGRGTSGEPAVNWRRLPIFLVAAALLLAFTWLIGRLTG
jgi:hypothetical protein